MIIAKKRGVISRAGELWTTKLFGPGVIEEQGDGK